MGNNKPEDESTFFSEKTGKIISLFGLVVIVLTILVYLIFGDWKFSKIPDESIIGQFGDFIGGFIGSMFSLAGVILFYVALKEQRKDISINQENIRLQTSALEQQVNEFQAQKTELEETRKVYEEQTLLIREQTNLYRQQNKELKEQSNTARVQQFDSSFFSYLNIFNEFRDSLDKKCDSGNFFSEIFSEIKGKDIQDNDKIEDVLQNICDVYLEVFNLYRNNLSPYFKTLYRIMVLIDTSNIDDYKKNEYFKLLRSQLSDVELLVLNYNYHTDFGLNVRTLIIKYNFLKHINLFDKLEFNFDIPALTKNQLQIFLGRNGNIIIEGINDFKNIESTEDINRSYQIYTLGLDVKVKLQINNVFNFSIVFLNQEFGQQNYLHTDLIKKIIKRHLYTILYMSKYIKGNEEEILFSKIEKEEEIEFLFQINNVESL
ncbi:Putative phage abortive infection protein [Myroides marinus]|uniref:Putative phage abortive infection protein n=1 Tax=Myroides marinus TaxID=703342 RepID=A0A1H6WEE9_9FLAO|nr:putative phage abortive infection protein [Myroides marinus]SEJ13604.1 Putative phage abortive infection protein [Myroides marinus]